MSRKKKGTKTFIKAVSVSVIGASSSVAFAAPTGGVAVSGGISIGTMNNNELVITQALQKGIINWTDFSIDAGELVRFAQNAGNDSITLNRVLGSQVSQIQGALQANGNIFLINPNGIVFGAGSQVDVAGLLATTFDVTDQSFLNGGQLNFTQVAGKDLASIANQGQITTGSGGFVYLVAPKVDNSGYVIANVGRVTMAAGDRFTVNLQGSNLINFSVSADTLAAATGNDLTGVNNSGTVKGDTVLLQGNSASGLMSSVVNNGGIIEATDLTINAGDIVQAGTVKGVGVAAATTATLAATNTITTADNSATRANTLNLSVTGAGASIGAEGAALRVDADVLNANAANGHVLVTDVNGGVALGEVNAGTATEGGSVVITAQNGSITSADTSKTNVSGYSAKFVADGAVGTDSDAVNTKVGVLSASTQNGGINVKNQGAVILGDVVAREQITINGQPAVSGAIDNSGSITLSNGNTGSKNVKVQATEGVVLTGTVSATNSLTVTSDTGSILAAQAGTSLVGRTVNLNAGTEVGDASQALSTQSNTVNAAAGNGGVYLSESQGLTIGTLTAAGTDNNVVLNATQGNITVGSITATGGKVDLTAGNGGITATGSGTNVTAAELTASSKSAIGAANKALSTSVDKITATTTAAQSGVYLSNGKALNSLSVTTPNGDTNVAFTGGSLVYSRNLNSLTLNRTQALDLSFSNTASGFKLNGIDAGADKSVSLTAAGDITQGSGSIVGKDVVIDASGNVGAVGTALQTQASTLNLTSRNGIANVANTSADLTVTAKANSTNGAVTVGQSGNLAVNSIVAKKAVELTAGGAVTTAADAVGTPISAGSLNVTAASIGTSSKALSSQVAGGAVNLTATGGDINYANIGAISLLDVLATQGKIAFQNSGDVVVGQVKAGGTVDFKVSGNVTDGNGSAANFITSGLTAAVKSFGTSGDAIEIQVDELVIDAANGGIYARQSNGNLLSLVQATSGGTGSDIQIAADGSIKLGNVDAGGNNVKLSAGGTIEDGRSNKTKANVVARELDMSAPGGIGKQGQLDLDVSFLSAAGGSGGVTATNAGAVAVNSSSLTGKGASAITIVATAITVLDNSGGTITMDGGSLTLTATSGNIVFLNQTDTIYLPGGGSITLTAMNKASSQVPGYDGVIIAGNLKTDGGNITLQAQSNITIGMLDAGTTGNVTVASAGGVILDGNGTAQNIRGNNVSLTASTPSKYTAELTRDTAIAEYSARDAEAAAKLLQLNILIQQLKDYEALVTSATVQNSLAELTQRLADISATAQSNKVDSMSKVADGLNTALNAASVVRNAAAVIAGAAQAIPFSGDAGADAAFAVVDLVLSAATLALDSYERYSLAPQQDLLVELNNTLDVANAAVYTAATNLATTTAIRDTTATSKATADLAVFKANTARDASLQVRKQAVAAYNLNQQIDSSADKPLGITANRLDINNGGVIDSSLYLDSAGSLGLGDITVAAGQKIVAEANNNIGVVGSVNSDTSISLKAGQAILGQGGTLATPDLKMVAGNGIGANQAVNTRTDRVAADAGNGGVAIVNANGGALLTIGTQGAVKGITGAGDISVTTDGSLKIDQLVKDSTHSHTVSLTSTNGSIIDGNTVERNVQGGTLVATATGAIDLDTDVDTLNAEVTHAGNITLREANAVTANRLQTASGNIDLTAGGAVLVRSLDAGTGTINLRADGAVDDDQDNSTLIVADTLNINAAGSVGATGGNANRALDTKVNTVNVTAAGEVNLADVDDLTIGTLETDHGNVTVTTGGSLNVGTLSTGTTSDTVTLVAGNQITNTKTDGTSNIDAANLTLRAENGIGAANALNVKVGNLAGTTTTGSLKLNDLDGDLVIGTLAQNLGLGTLSGLNSTDGAIEVGTAGNLTVNNSVTATTSGAVRLSAGGDVQQNAQIETENGDISVRAGGNVQQDEQILADTGNIAVKAGGNIQQNAHTKTNVGNIAVTADGDITMGANTHTVSSVSGNVTVAAGVNASLQDVGAYAGDVNVSAQQGNLVQNGQLLTGTGNITAHAGRDLTTLGLTGAMFAGNIDLSAGGNISLQHVGTNGGNIKLNAGGDLTQHQQVLTAAGNITAHAGGDLTTQTDTTVVGAGNINYSAGGNANLQQVTTGNGNVDLKATGNLTQNALVQTGAGNITAHADGDLTTQTDTTVVGTGNINYSAGGNANLQQVTTGNGNIDLAATGNLTQNALVQTGAGNITTSAGRDVTLNGETSTAQGNIALSAGQNLTQNALVHTDAGDVTTFAGNDVTLNDVTSTFNGNVNLTAGRDLTQNALVNATQGNVGAKAGRDLLMTSVASTTTTTGNVDYSAAGNATVQEIGVDSGNVSVTAQGNLVQNGTLGVNNGNVSVDAKGDLTMSVGALTNVNSQGNVAYTAGGNLLIDQIRTADGNATLTAKAGDIQVQGNAARNVTAKQLTATASGNIGSNDALRTDIDTLVAKADSGSIVVDEANAITLDNVAAANGQVSVNAGDIAIKQLQGDSIALTSSGKVETLSGGLVKGGDLNVDAETGVNLHTAVDSATVWVNGSGNIALTEDDAITLTRLNTADGNIRVTAGGDIGVNTVNAGSQNVSLTSTGGAIVTQQPSFFARMLARVAQATGITGDRIELDAANGLGNGSQGALKLTGNTLDASTTRGDVNLAQSQAATLENVSTGNGNVQVVVADGNAVVGNVSGTGSVALTAENGQLVDDGNSTTRVQGNALNLSATDGIGANGALQTKATSINAQVSNSGNIAINEADGLDRLTVNSANGDVAVNSATGNLNVDVINATGHAVTLNANAGAIRDVNNNTVSNVNAQSVNLNAANGVGQAGNAFDVNVRNLASNGGNGGAALNSTSTSALNLTALTASQGDIVLTSAGDLNVNGGVSHTGGGNITLNGGNINQNANITTSGRGNVSVNGSGNVVMAPTSTTSTGNGTVSYTGGRSISVASIQTSNDVGGGRVVFVAPQVLDNMPGVANVRAWSVSLKADNGTNALIQELMGDVNDSSQVDLGNRVIGGSLAESRRFMEALLQPAMVQQTGPEKLFDAGLLNASQVSPFRGFVEGEDGVMTYNK
ncbi:MULTISPECIES: filamentous hemagglutinin N-terminal domain-containing protein [unclassified Pseudomonas]|uniref:filamentous hemagglutinin N-terminal domain-containing protein n=1 Tax=unclassified Pseudomonas TaxID=196821 RepID=UPI0021C89956|nr:MULTISPECIES: filamentous hemagglutinin N-terminal domain-containing protein [unclassified Pseudomonas]MCU1732675.1 filamentous hemagglutinin N-terminal domain-containing protein [Pseudomonas sp. 20P_3.2_Bac4]MCU1744025.1 filamentous hemagglutinin N-terminal domain-containing protein [Pseudomonas sp. 20P_3.2_Bac5]